MRINTKLFAILAVSFFPGMALLAENPVKGKDDKFNIAVECIKRWEGWHGEKKHWPYVGWGHNYPNLDIILTLHCK